MAPTDKRRRLCSELALKTSLESGLYPDFLGAEGPAENHDPESNSAFRLSIAALIRITHLPYS